MNGLAIKQGREKLGLTQQQFADRIGVSRETIINYEKGRPIPNLKVKYYIKCWSQVIFRSKK